MLLPFIRVILGLVFLITGISKIPIFQAFVHSIDDLFTAPDIILYPIAVVVILFEIGAGAALVFKFRTRIVSAAVSVLLVLFIILLSSALFRYEQYICKCFGILGLEIPVMYQIIIDFILLNMAVFVMYFSPSSKQTDLLERFIDTLVSRKFIVGILSISFIWSAAVVVQPQFIFGERLIKIDFDKIFAYVSEQQKESIGIYPQLVFLVNFGDLYCPSCLDDFLYLSNAVERNTDGDNFLILFQKIDQFSTIEQLEMLTAWKRAVDVNIEMHVDERNLLDEAGFEKTVVVLFDKHGSVVMFETLPMGSRQRDELLRRFLEKQEIRPG